MKRFAPYLVCLAGLICATTLSACKKSSDSGSATSNGTQSPNSSDSGTNRPGAGK